VFGTKLLTFQQAGGNIVEVKFRLPVLHNIKDFETVFSIMQNWGYYRWSRMAPKTEKLKIETPAKENSPDGVVKSLPE
jgi:hypothetical protein